MNNVNDLLVAIRSIDNNDDMGRVIDEVNMQMKRVSRMAAKTFKLGDTVYFTDRTGREIDGIVTKVNPKTIHVNVGMNRFRVDASLLRSEPQSEAA